MNIANQVKSLTEDIEASYGERMSWLADATKNTHQMMTRIHGENKEAADAVAKLLAHFRGDHKAMADELRDSLSTSERERMKDFAILIKDVKAAVEAIEKDTAETRAENVREIRERIEEVSKMLSGFRGEHREMAKKLAEFLSSSEKVRMKDFAILIKDVKAAVEAIEKDTANMRAENVRELKEMAQEVKEFLSEVANDLRQARTHWQNLAKVMAAKRAGKSIPAPRAQMGVPAIVKEEAEEAFAGGELKDRVLKVVQAHPGGIRLSKIGKKLKIAYIQAAKPIKDLLAEVKITKRDSKYLPA